MARTARSNFVSKMEDGAFWEEETPTGSVNGSNKSFTLSGTPNPQSSVELEVNGQTVPSADYSISGDTLTTDYPYPSGTVLYVRYRVEPS